MDRARDDADLGPARRRRAGAVRADQPRAGGADRGDDRDHVERRDALGDAEDRADPGGGRLEDRVRRAAAGTKMQEVLAPVSRTASATVSNTGTVPSSAFWPPLPGVIAGDDAVP